MSSTGVDLLAIVDEVNALVEVGGASQKDVRRLRRILREQEEMDALWGVYQYLLLSPTIQDMRVIRKLSSAICLCRPVPFRPDDPEWNRESIPPGLWLACVLPPMLAEENPEVAATAPIVELLLDLIYGEDGFDRRSPDPEQMDDARACLVLIEREVSEDLPCCRRIMASALAAIAEAPPPPPPPPPAPTPKPKQGAKALQYQLPPNLSADVVLEAFLAVAQLVGKFA